MNLRESHTVPKQEKPIRLSDYAGGIFQSIPSRKGMKKAIQKGWVKVDEALGKTGTFLYGGEKIHLFEVPSGKAVLEIKIDVIYEDEYLAVVNKPPGMEVSGNKWRTLENALPFNLKKSGQPDALERPRPAHRLDHPTTGLVLVGKTSSAIIALNRLFEEKRIQKTYHAISIGAMENEGRIDFPVDGKPSLTEFRVLNSVKSPRFSILSLVELQPHTGRRHQLRKHLTESGNPILGDQIYGKDGLILKGKGLYLNASRLEFLHPITGEKLNMEQDLPKRFLKIFDVPSPSPETFI